MKIIIMSVIHKNHKNPKEIVKNFVAFKMIKTTMMNKKKFNKKTRGKNSKNETKMKPYLPKKKKITKQSGFI